MITDDEVNNPLLATADSFGASGGQPSIFAQAYDLATKGTVLTGISALRSFVNTGRQFSSWLSNEPYEESRAADWINEVDDTGNWQKYYDDHAQGIEVAGLISGSFLPGGLAVKAMKMAGGTKTLGAFGEILGYRTAATERAVAAIARKEPTAFGAVRSDRYRAIAAGFGEQALLGAGWEAATIATMKANPSLEADSFGDIASHVFFGALVGGTVGGVFEGFLTEAVFKKAILQRASFDNLVETLKGAPGIDVLASDKVAAILRHLDAIPAAADSAQAVIKSATQNTEILAAKIELGKLVPKGQEGIQSEFLDFILRMRDEGQLTNEQLYDKLGGLKEISRIGLKKAAEETFEEIELRVGKNLTTPRILNIKTGATSDKAHPVVGDIAEAKAIKYITGVAGETTMTLGEQVSFSFKNNLIEGFGPSIHAKSPLMANARYVWAEHRGIKAGDIISVEDLPLLEEAARSWGKYRDAYRSEAQQVLLRTADGNTTPIIWDPQILKQQIMEQKQILAKELLAAGKDADDIAMRINIRPEKLPDLNTAEWGASTIPVAEHLELNHVALSYPADTLAADTGNTVRGMIAVEQRIQDGIDHARTVAAQFFAQADVPAETFYAARTASAANIFGAAPSAFGFANAGYNTLAGEVQRIGGAVKNLLDKLNQTALDRLIPAFKVIGSSPDAGAEFAALDNVMRKTGERYKFIDDPALVAEYFQSTGLWREGDKIPKAILVHHSSIVSEVDKFGVPIRKLVKPTVVGDEADQFVSYAAQRAGASGKYGLYPVMEEETARVMRQHMDVNKANLVQKEALERARGRINEADNIAKSADYYYAPALDTTKYKFISFVRYPDGKGGVTNHTGTITATSAEQLAQKEAALKEAFGETYQIIHKSDIAKYHKAQGDYDYNMNLVQQQVDSTLRRKGLLADIQPDLNVQNITDNYLAWHQHQTRRLVHGYTELSNAQLFADLKLMGEQYSAAASSKLGTGTAKLGKQAENPYQEYMDTALNISPKYHYTLWQDSQEKIEGLYNSAFSAARSAFTDAKKGIINYEQAAAITERLGLGGVYGKNSDQAAQAMYTASQRIHPSAFRELIHTTNSIVAATVVRLDVFQSLINAVSTPILLLAETSSIQTAALKELTSVKVPGTPHSVPSGTKLLAESIGDFFGGAKTPLMDQFHARGLVPNREKLAEYFAMNDELARAAVDKSKWKELLTSATDKAASISLSPLSEEFTRFVTANVGHKMFSALGHTGEDLWTNVQLFVNRVQGNYLASQRPVAFQGPVGQAIGLFQTYQFNLMQQLFRYAENGEAKTIATLLGLQGTLFGMQGMPGFHILNSHIVGNAANNPQHNDVFTGINSYAGKEIGDWMMYGSLSNITRSALYSRGDINPRQISILPISPLDWPAISGAGRFVNSVFDTTNKIAGGSDVFKTLMFGMEHNGLSRPVSGIGQILSGKATTSAGSLVSAVDWSNITNAARIGGARPIDEAIAMDAMYRKTMYDAVDHDRMKSLGAKVKISLDAGKAPEQEEVLAFQERYAKAGGRPEHFGATLTHWMRDATTPVANTLAAQLNNPKARNVYNLMGGEGLPSLQFSTAAGSTAVPQQ